MAVAVPLITGAVGQALATNLAWTVAANYAISTATFGAIVAVGGMLGAALGAALIAPGLPDVEGPQALEGMGQVSTYGKFIPVVYGRSRFAGNIIWSKGIREVKTTEEVGGKGGGGGQTVTTYTYYCSWGLALGEGKVQTIHKIWFDADLVYDQATGKTNGALSSKMTFYYGSEDQEPDPLMEADNGVGNVPAYRGICYVVFNDVLLTDWGNRIPNITVELSRFPDVGDTSNIYPIEVDTDSYVIDNSYTGGLIYVKNYYQSTTMLPEYMSEPVGRINTSVLRTLLLNYPNYAPEYMSEPIGRFRESALRTLLLNYPNYAPEYMSEPIGRFRESVLKVVLVSYTNYPAEYMSEPIGRMTGGSLS